MNEKQGEQVAQTAQSTQSPQMGATGVRKRQQIENTNKQIFIWLAVASIIVSVCLVALQFLIREFMFNQKIINQKNETNGRLIKNVKEAKALQDNVNALLANENLNALKYETKNAKTSSLNVVLDALPVEGDATAFANSLQAVVLPRSGVGIRELSTMAMGGEIGTDDVAATSGQSQVMTLPFSAGFRGKYANVQQALIDISRVIRPINLTELSIRAVDDGALDVTTSGVTYYLPARSVEVRTEVIKP